MKNSKMMMGLALGAGLLGYGFRPDGFLASNKFVTEQATKWKVPPPVIVAVLAYVYLKWAKPRVTTYQYWAAWGAVAAGAYFAARAHGQDNASQMMGWWDRIKSVASAAKPWLQRGTQAAAQHFAPGLLPAQQPPAGIDREMLRQAIREELAARRRRVRDHRAAWNEMAN